MRITFIIRMEMMHLILTVRIRKTECMERRVANIHARNEMLRATEAQHLRIERDRVNAHLHGMPEGLQRLAAQHHVGDLTRRIHKLAQEGLAH